MVPVGGLAAQFSKRRTIHFDFVIITATFLLIGLGILFIYSGNASASGGAGSNEYIRQLIWALSGTVLLVAFSAYNYKRFKSLAKYIYAAGLILLVITLLFGREVNGAKSWLGLGPLGIQPSEFCKIALILFLSIYLDRNKERITQVKTFIRALLIMVPMLGLILLQPDLGTSAVYIPITLVICFMAGVPIKYIGYVLCIGFSIIGFVIIPEWLMLRGANASQTLINILANTLTLFLISSTLLVVSGIAFFGYRKFSKKYFYYTCFFASSVAAGILASILVRNFLQEFQILRLIIFINPYFDPRGAGWNVIQSVTAIGSGGLFGKGLLNGVHSQFNYLPQQSTDFIFSILGEEWGFVGALAVLGLFLTITLRGLSIISNCRDSFGTYVGAGILTMFLFHFSINVGMTMGIMPITGIPLIFLSHGGSALWTGMIGVGILVNINLNKL